MAKADSPTKICGESGCGRPLRARGLCVTHYNQQHHPDRHPKVTVPCTWCEAPCVKDKTRANRYSGLFCSLACRDEWARASGRMDANLSAARAAQSSRWGAAVRKLRKAAHGTRGCIWVAGSCERCGTAFVSPSRGAELGRFCSDKCKRRTKGSRRRARKRGARHERYSRAAIFERDRWRCHICKRKTLRTEVVPHPRAPVIDHLVPLAEGGDDTAANVATACFMCNSIKRECGGGEQLALFG